MNAAVIRKDKLIVKGSPLTNASAGNNSDLNAVENPQPFFRQPDLPVAAGPNLPEDKKYSFGRETGFRILPYTMQDRYGRELVDMEFPSLVMENDFLRAEFVPALGGRLWSLFDKQRNRDILYRNPVFRPANLAIRDAWFSGGVEWNLGRLGHAVHTCSPVFAGIVQTGNLAILRLWEYERQTRLFWRIDFTLPNDSAVLFAYTRIENPDSVRKPLYWWTNAAIPQTPGVRVFSASDEVIYIVPGTGKVKTMDYGRLPDLPVLPGKDASYPALSDYSNEYFFQNDRACNGKNNALPWEGAVYEDGYAYGEISTPPLLYRKMFCWGSGRGGRRWQDFLSLPGEEYLEVQAGLAPTQLHSADIEGADAHGSGTVDWVQAFTAFTTDTSGAFQKDYRSAAAYVEDCLKKQISAAAIQNALELGRARAGDRAEILSMGSGWGALEIKLCSDDSRNGSSRNGEYSPGGLSFPDESIGEAEAQWASLLRTGALPPRPPEAGPGSFVADEAWETVLKASTLKADAFTAGTGCEDDWLTPYHLGIICYERGACEEAAAYWNDSIKRKENPWAYRNLALYSIRRGDKEAALDYYRRAMELGGGKDQSFTEEYIPLLLETGKMEEAETKLNAFIRGGTEPADPLQALSPPLLDAAARLALGRGDDTALDRIFSVEQAHIREGNTTLMEIWTEREIRKLCGKGAARAAAEQQVNRAIADGVLVPPREIDFRMYTAK